MSNNDDDNGDAVFRRGAQKHQIWYIYAAELKGVKWTMYFVFVRRYRMLPSILTTYRNDGNLRFFISVVVAVVHITQSYSNPTRIRVGLV